MGGDGTISVTANVAPAAISEITRMALAGEAADARALDASMTALNEALFLESNPIPVKWALAEMGRIQNALRLPLTPLAEEFQAQVRAALKKAGVL